MNLKKIGVTLLLCFIIIFLIIVNIGLNITGPYYYDNYKDEVVLKTVKKDYPWISNLYRHRFKYLTYSYYDNSTVYVFDYEGELVVKKDFDLQSFDEIKEIVKNEYGLDDVDVHIGFGYNDIVYVVEEENVFIYFDYETKEVVYYVRGNLI